MDKESLLRQVRKDEVVFVQLWFSDIHGNLKRKTIMADELAEALERGSWFDGSSIEGFTRIQESDAQLLPDPTTYQLIPWARVKDEETGRIKRGARIFCDVLRPDGQSFEGDPRYILKRALAKAKRMGFIYNTSPEVEFFLFKQRGQCLVPLDRAGYFDATGDLAHGFRDSVVARLDKMGIVVEMTHHEVSPGQYEIGIKYSDALSMADSVMTVKHVIERTARDKYKWLAVFMPKPIANINGSGMHTHQSLFRAGDNAFCDMRDRNAYHLSEIARQFIAGQIAHVKALSAIMAPTVNSYKRLVPGYEAPTYICWGGMNRAALIRVPAYTSEKPKSVRCELRASDPLCNPYLAFAAMLAAGLDGIEKGFSCPKPAEGDVFKLSPEELESRGIGQLPGSLKEALDYLEQDDVILNALGGHTAKWFLDAKKKECEEYEEACGGDTGTYSMQVTGWEIRKYLFGGYREEDLTIRIPK